MSRPTVATIADVCIIIEGAFPHAQLDAVHAAHALIAQQPHLMFHVVSLVSPASTPEANMVAPSEENLPENVVGVSVIQLHDLPKVRRPKPLDMQPFHAPLSHLLTGTATPYDMQLLQHALQHTHTQPSAEQLLASKEAFALIRTMYHEGFEDSSFLDYVTSWRTLVGGVLSIMVAKLPEAKVYHALQSGYAGLLAARAKMDTDRAMLLSEDATAVMAQQIALASQPWLEDVFTRALSIDTQRQSLRDMWLNFYENLSRIAYQSADYIVSVHEGIEHTPLMKDVDAQKVRVIPYGVDVERFASIQPKAHEQLTIAWIGRVVPTKDVKNYLRACALLREHLPDIRALVIGATDEDARYYAECLETVAYLGLESTVEFTGHVVVDDYLGEVDVLVLSSLYEVQPMVILEAGAAGIPCVVTDVGACRELIEGKTDEAPALGKGGEVVAILQPAALAQGVLALLSDRYHYADCSAVMRQRVAQYYSKQQHVQAYKTLYDACIHAQFSSGITPAQPMSEEGQP
jgi:glycosyltransferase involved in cell wall biosynthesis